MESYLQRILKTIIADGLLFASIAVAVKTKNHLPWGLVLTTKFWILAVLHLIPIYFVVWSFEDNYESWWESRVILNIIVVLWAIVFGIICLISHFVFGFDLL